jgi:RHS repeat-associated protein
VLVGSDGTSYAVWQDSRNGNADIYFSKLTQGGSAWSANVKVSDDPGTAAQTAPRIGIDSAGNLTVIWLDARTSPAQLRVSRQTAGSNTWSASTQLTDAAARPSGTPALSERPDGSAWVAWTDTRIANTDIWASQYTGGSWTTSTKLSDDPGAFAQSNPTLAYSTAELAQAWRDDRSGNADIRAARIAYGTGTDHFGYSYDGLERLTAGTTTNPESFTLDPGSNIASRTGPSATYTYDTANRLTSDGTQAFTWNTADRLTNRGPDTFGYDPLDRMTGSTVSATVRTYAYNGDGLLKSRTQGASTTQFLWDPSSSPSRLLVQGSDKLIYGLGPLWVVKADGSTSSFARDGGKSVRAEVNGSGTVTASFRYRAYGAIAQSNGATTPSYLGYADQFQDPSGLLYMRARWYDPNVGRFTIHDPVSGTPLNPRSLNAYAYAAANPLVMSDPTGLAWARDELECQLQTCADSAPSSGLSDAESPETDYLLDDIKVVNHAQGILGFFVTLFGGYGQKANTVTFGSYLIASTGDVPTGSALLAHELGHVNQARQLGGWYLPAYVLAIPGTVLLHGLDWHDYHPAEENANERAHLNHDQSAPENWQYPWPIGR